MPIYRGRNGVTYVRKRSTASGEPTADGVAFSISGLTPTDASNILGSASQNGVDITVTLDADTISNTPATAVYWERPIEDVFGDTIVVDLIDLFRSIVRVDNLVPQADLHVGMALVSADERGFAVRIAAVSGDWQVQHASSTAGTWSAWSAATSDGDTQGVMGVLSGRGNSSLQGRFNALGLDSVGVDQGGATSTPTTTAVNIGNTFTKVRLFVGTIAGGLGIPGPVVIQAGHVAAKVLDFPAILALFQ